MIERPWVPPRVDYEEAYKEGRNPFGPPIREFQRFFERSATSQLRVLDLGCGQGRDALVAARAGHFVVGIDKACSGVTQMVLTGRREGLNLHGIAADVLIFEPRGSFDVVVLGYVLHTLPRERDRWGSNGLLARAIRLVGSRGTLVISETPMNTLTARELLRSGTMGSWRIEDQTANCVIAVKG